jgi:hypothetical protein
MMKCRAAVNLGQTGQATAHKMKLILKNTLKNDFCHLCFASDSVDL